MLLIGTGLRGELDDIYRRNLESQLGLAQVLIESSPDADTDSLARVITGSVGNRVTIISTEGSFSNPLRGRVDFA